MTNIVRETANKNIKTIHHLGDVTKAEIAYGKKRYNIERQEKVFVVDPNMHTAEWVTCAPYDNHFVYLLPPNIEGWFAMCTCGGPAVIVGYNAYKKDASPTDTGKMLLCYHHANSGKHADGSS